MFLTSRINQNNTEKCQQTNMYASRPPSISKLEGMTTELFWETMELINLNSPIKSENV